MSTANTLNRELRQSTLIGSSALAGPIIFLALNQSQQIAWLWLPLAALLWGGMNLQIYRLRDLNRADAEAALYSQLGWGTRATILRGWLIAATGGFLLLTQHRELAWLPALLYSLAAILDRVDGYLARRSRHTTLMGSELDTAFDALGLLIAPLLAVLYGKVHWSYLLVSIAYYCFRLGIYWRNTHGLPVYPLQANKLRRALAGFQMGFVAVVLWPFVQAPVSLLASFAFMLPLLAGFIIDWGVVSGRILPQHQSTATLFSSAARFSHLILQPALRLVLVMAVAHFSYTHELSFAASAREIILLGVMLGSAALILLGLAARVAALALVVVFAVLTPVLPVDFASLLIILCAVWTLLLGAGAYSLWQGDDVWVNRQDGAQ